MKLSMVETKHLQNFFKLTSPTSDAKQKAKLCRSKSMTSEFQYFIKIAYLTKVNQEYVNIFPTPPQYAAQHSSDFKYPRSRTNSDVSKSSMQLKTRSSDNNTFQRSFHLSPNKRWCTTHLTIPLGFLFFMHSVTSYL